MTVYFSYLGHTEAHRVIWRENFIHDSTFIFPQLFS